MKRSRKEKRERRKKHIRKTVYGTPEIPRLYVYKSNRYTYVGVVNDYEGTVLKSLRGEKGVENAKELGKAFAKELGKLKIKRVVFDRSGYKFHGMVKGVADGLKSEGIKF